MAVIEDAQHLHHEATPSESPSQRSSTISSNPSAGTVRDGSSGNSALTSETGPDSTDLFFPLENFFSQNLGFYDTPSPSPSSLGFPSHPSKTFPPSSYFSMSSDGRLSDKSDLQSHSTYLPGMSRRSSQQQQQSQSSMSNPSSRVQPQLPMQPTLLPPYFPSSPACGVPSQTQPQQEATSTSVDQNISAPLSRGTAGTSSLFTGSPPPAQSYPSRLPYSPRAGYGGPFTMPSQPPHPFPNPPHQSYPYSYHVHPALPPDSGQYQQGTGYVPIVQHHLQPYYPHHSASDGAPYPPPPHGSISPQSVAGTPGPSHTPTYPPQPYQPLHYGASSPPFTYSQHFQPGPYQWYYVSGSPAAPFNEGMQMQFPPHHPMTYPPNQQMEGRSGPPSERQSQVSPPQVSSSVSAPLQGRKPILPQSAPQPSQSPALAPSAPSVTPASQFTMTGGEKSSPASSTVPTRTHTERPVVRRSYHPNPPANRSEWVMWVGNVPGDTTHDELWRFLTRPASPEPEKEDTANGVTSIFLISRSNCAFVNFETEGYLQNAIGRFNGQQLRPNDRRCPRLVCRARRREDDLRAGVGGQRGMGVHTEHVRKQRWQEREKADEARSSAGDGSQASEGPFRSLAPPALPLSSDEEVAKAPSPTVKAQSVSSYASTTSSFLSRHFPKRFFILKSLTQFDLDLSVERELWATQKHNEMILDQAYRTSKEVILIFSVNKSGEFYGYARMASRILRGESNVSWASRTDDSPSSILSVSPQGRKQLRTAEGSPQSPTCSREGPLAHFTPSKHHFIEDSPMPISSSEQEWKSAPARFGPSPPEEFPIELATPRFSLGGSIGLRPAAPIISKASAAANIPARDIVLDRNAPVRAVRNVEGPKAGKSSLVREENPASSVGGGGDVPEAPRPAKQTGLEHHDGEWGEPFKVEWLCTQRVPFQRTRHLRNAWNHDREIKVSRDGTELEPGVGQTLIDEWVALAAVATEGEGGRTQNSGKRSTKSTPRRPLTPVEPSTKGNEHGPS